MSIAVILVNFNSHDDLIEAVRSLEESRLPKDFLRRVIIVDNASEKESWEKIQPLQKYPDVELIRSKTNLGFAGGNNLGLKRALEAGSDFFLLLNPDTKVSRDFLIELLKPFISTMNPVGLASPKIYFYPGFETHGNRYQKSDLGRVLWYAGGIIDWKNVVGGHRSVDLVDSSNQQPETRAHVTTDFATGCCLLISRPVIEKIGLLDEKYFFSWEDVDYSVRAKKAGFDVLCVPKSLIWHKNAATSGGPGSILQDYYQTRHRLIFAFKYAPIKTKVLLLWQLLRTADSNRLKAVFSALTSAFFPVK